MKWKRTFEYENLLQHYRTKEKSAPLSHVTHFCFLMHGHKGHSWDLSYLQAMLQKNADEIISSQNLPEQQEVEANAIRQENVIVHNLACNEKKTHDGIQKGGVRIAGEIMNVIDEELRRRKAILKQKRSNVVIEITEIDTVMNITISMVGNSLGGLYLRYAIAILAEIFINVENDGSYTMVIDELLVRMNFNVFGTTATPHLGVSKHTWVPLSRKIETTIAHFMRTTGYDLFCMSNLVKEMGTKERFLEPLSTFHRRIAYANSFHTDFPVPTNTAAFLNEESSCPHYYTPSSSSATDVDNDDINYKKTEIFDKQNPGLIVAAFQTKKSCSFENYKTTSTSFFDEQEREQQQKIRDKRNQDIGINNDDLLLMSNSLDALGWKKVFVDLSSEINVNIPNFPNERRKNTNPPRTKLMPNVHAKSMSEALQAGNNILQSKQLISVLSPPREGKLKLPMGHNLIVANSKTKLSHLRYKGGRPVMDHLAADLIDNIFSWRLRHDY